MCNNRFDVLKQVQAYDIELGAWSVQAGELNEARY